ncbi:hypothetical protein [Neisseria musculi]|uniref:Lipoprotein n=2 Tax=Neisseria TaxID=482 RepID=A0A7H1ME10_9NEIS|nr:hypothetical protein [Neisseria musculi]QNT59875.1 hypothetical protein H7A79_2082 [Neisseria musculi]
MNNKILLVMCAAAAVGLAACGAVQTTPSWGGHCPKPATDGNGMLEIKNGQTLKCQIRVFTSNMGCTEKITNPSGDDGYVCTGGNKGAVFFFDNNGVLKSHEFIER